MKCASTAPPQHFNSVLLRTELCQLSRTGSWSLSVSTEEPSSCGISWGKKTQTLGLSALARTPSQFSPNLSQASSHSFDVGYLVPFTFPGTDPSHSWGLHTRLHPLQLFTIWLISDTDPGTWIECFQLERTE